jgi:predicted pyridoxine 5'-phosphate oxidase superfamily flavin-nucleotide-binding protein
MHDDRQPAILHPGELEAQRRFGAEGYWDTDRLAMIRDHLPPTWTAFLEAQAFFFIATANRAGACDCSFRGREFDASGRPYALLKVLDKKTLVFPDFSGNRLYNSLGNLLENPQIGLLFVDFQQRARARVNGDAEIIEDRSAHQDLWPTALRYVRVTVRQAYPNCKARIPPMAFVPLPDAFFDE